MKEIDYVHKKRPLEFKIFPYKIKVFTIEKNKKFEYPDGKFDIYCCIDVEFTNLLEVESINTHAFCCGSEPKLIDTKGHQYGNEMSPGPYDPFENENGEFVCCWAQKSSTVKYLFPIVDGEIWGGVSTRGWIVWPKIPDDAEIKRIILTLDASPDEAAKSPLAGMPGMSTVTWVAINVNY